jgi:polyisoprenoid-binding protein YceI
MSTTTDVQAVQGTLTWNIDSAHSSIDFSVRHMGIFTVRGSLGTLTGSGTTVDGVLTAATLSIDVAAISTNNAQRDGHLKSADFLNTDQYPTITFVGTTFDKKSDTSYTITGDMTIAGQTKPVTVDVEIVPPVKDPWGGTRAGATGEGKLKRTDWGLTYNSVMETGHLMIAEEVKFTFDIQAVIATA